MNIKYTIDIDIIFDFIKFNAQQKFNDILSLQKNNDSNIKKHIVDGACKTLSTISDFIKIFLLRVIAKYNLIFTSLIYCTGRIS